MRWFRRGEAVIGVFVHVHTIADAEVIDRVMLVDQTGPSDECAALFADVCSKYAGLAALQIDRDQAQEFTP